jgi:hypothetical protein
MNNRYKKTRAVMKKLMELSIFWLFPALSFGSFTVSGNTIQPACVSLFDQQRTPYPVIVGVDINRCQASGNISHMAKSDGRRIYFLYQNSSRSTSDGYYGYQVIGQATNGTYVLHSFTQLPGDNKIFDALLFIKLEDQYLNIYVHLNKAVSEKTTKMLLVGYMPGGDRCSGGIKSAKIDGNILTVDQYPAINSVDQCQGSATVAIDMGTIPVE